MTNTEREAIKAELRSELLAEIRQPYGAKCRTEWDELKELITRELGGISSYSKHACIQAISCLMREALGIRHVSGIGFQNANIARIFVAEVMVAYNRAKKSAAELNRRTVNR